jgi:hypothetical protein
MFRLPTNWFLRIALIVAAALFAGVEVWRYLGRWGVIGWVVVLLGVLVWKRKSM